jgi:hypothetical protein
MKKILLLLILLATTTFVVAQTPKKPRTKKMRIDYKGCVTPMDSLVRRITYQVLDSMRNKKYIID